MIEFKGNSWEAFKKGVQTGGLLLHNLRYDFLLYSFQNVQEILWPLQMFYLGVDFLLGWESPFQRTLIEH